MNLDEDGNGVIFTSIQTDMILDEFYLISENSEGKTYRLKLQPRKFVLPNKDMFESDLIPAKPYCYLAPSGDYQIKKIFALFSSSGPGFTTSGSGAMGSTRHVVEIDIPAIRFQATPEKISYLGRFLFLDPRMGGKNQAGRMGTMIGAFFSGRIIPDKIEIDIIDKLEEDSKWGFDKYPVLQNEAIVNLAEDPTRQIVPTKSFP